MTRLPDGFATDDIYTEEYFQGGRADGYANYADSEPILRAEFRGAVKALRRAARASGTLLEIGCAYGFFLAEAKPFFDVRGVEVSESAVRFCRSRGLDVERGPFGLKQAARGPFDAVVMLDVVEHLRNPAETLGLVHEAMAPGGILMLTTGDWESGLSRVMGKNWRLMTPPQHTFFFSPRTMSAMLARFGFKVVACSKPWRMVPLGLIIYQLGRILGMEHPPRMGGFRLGLPVNLFDAFRILAVRP
jgi:SAM-dependent methyltransferase